MRTLTTFRSNKFAHMEEHEDLGNPELFGDDLCLWMIEQLNKAGFHCDTKPEKEDYGWYFNFALDGQKYCFVSGFRPPDGGEPGCWIVWIEKAAGFFASLFGGREKNIDPLVPSKIHQILSTCPEITDIRWHRKRDFDANNEEVALSTPD